ISQFSLLKLAAQTVNFRLLVVRSSCGFAFDVAHATLYGALRLRDGLGPRAAHLHDLRPVREAVSRKQTQLRVCLTPTGEGAGPFPDAIECKNALTTDYRRAIYDAGNDRRQAARARVQQRFIQQGQSVLDPACADQGATL